MDVREIPFPVTFERRDGSALSADVLATVEGEDVTFHVGPRGAALACWAAENGVSPRVALDTCAEILVAALDGDENRTAHELMG